MKKIVSILLAVILVMSGIASTVWAEEYVEEVFTEEGYAEASYAEAGYTETGYTEAASIEEGYSPEEGFQESFDDVAFDEITPFENDAQPGEDSVEVYYEETTVTEDAAFTEDASVEEDLAFSEEAVSPQEEGAEEVTEESITGTLAEEEPDAAAPDELISDAEIVADGVGEIPAFADADKSSGSLRVTMNLKSKEGEEICVQGEPHLFIYLKQLLTSDGKEPTAPQEYTIRLRNLSKGSGKFWTVSSQIGNPVAGLYTVKYYTPFAGAEADCERKVPSYVETAPDLSLMYEIQAGEAFAGATMTLYYGAVENLLISKTTDTKLELEARATTRAFLIPGAYKKISGIKSTKSKLAFELYSSNSDGEAGELLMTADTDGAMITEELGYGLYFDPVLLPAPGDYWFLVREDNSRAAYFTPVTASAYYHATVGYSDAGILNITALEYLEGSVRETNTSRKITVASAYEMLTIKGNNQDVSGDTVYELYGPFEGHSPKRDDEGSFGKPIQTKRGSSYTFSNVELFGHYYTYVIVERESEGGTENRDHMVMITGVMTSDGAQWYIKDRASFINNYTADPVQQTFTIKNEIKGLPSSSQAFSFRLRRVSDGQIATLGMEGNTTGTKDVILPSFSKPGTYEYRITEVKGTAAGFSYNTEGKTYKLKYVVKDDGKGKLIVTTYVDGEKVKSEKPVLTFRNKYEVKVQIQHVNADSTKGVSGGKAQIVNGDGAVVKKTWKSDGTPKKVSVTADGTYTVREVKAPTGYRMGEDASFTVRDGEVTYNKQAVSIIKIPHTMITGSFTFKKVSSSDTKKAVSDAEFYLYRIAYDKGTVNYESAAENLKKGTIKWNQLKAYKRSISQEDGAVTFTTLEPDTYYVIKENSITGQPYQLTPESKSAVIATKYSEQDKALTTKVVSGKKVLVSSSGSWIWKDTPTKVTIYVRSSGGALLKGAKLALTDSAGRTIDSWESGASGHTITEKLNLGESYKVTQTNELQGYSPAPAVIFTVKQENGNGQKVTLTAQKTAPTSITIKSLTANGNNINVTWNKPGKAVDGYQVRYSTTKDFSGNVKTIKVTDMGTTSLTIKNLKNNTSYYVQIRTYLNTNTSEYEYTTYSKWSAAKSVTTK